MGEGSITLNERERRPLSYARRDTNDGMNEHIGVIGVLFMVHMFTSEYTAIFSLHYFRFYTSFCAYGVDF